MTPDLGGLGDVAVLLLVLDRVVMIVRAARGKDSGRHHDVLRQLVDAVKTKDGFESSVTVRIEHLESEVDRLRTKCHELSRAIQDAINHRILSRGSPP